MMRRSSTGRLARWAMLAAWLPMPSLEATAADAAPAPVPKAFRGKWTADRGHCVLDKNAPLAILTIGRSSLGDLETACDVAWPRRSPQAVRLAARCYVGGADRSPAVIVMKSLTPDEISVTFLALPGMGDKPQIYHRCSH